MNKPELPKDALGQRVHNVECATSLHLNFTLLFVTLLQGFQLFYLWTVWLYVKRH